jgi:hypothetical protein
MRIIIAPNILLAQHVETPGLSDLALAGHASAWWWLEVPAHSAAVHSGRRCVLLPCQWRMLATFSLDVELYFGCAAAARKHVGR